MNCQITTIPALTDAGLLPEGVHTCSLEEVRERFGRFDRSDRRSQLTKKLAEFVGELKSTGLVAWVGVDGSYVTSKPEPDDVDLVVVLRAEHDFSQELPPTDYNLVSKRKVRARFGFDVLVAPEDSPALREHLDFFQLTRDGVAKGILKVVP